MKRLVLLLIFIVLNCFCKNLSLKINDRIILFQQLVEAMETYHLNPKELNDELSKEVYHFFLKKIDPHKSLFTQKDLNNLSKYEDKIDEELRNGRFDFLDETINILKKNINKTESYALAALNHAFSKDFSEAIETNIEKLTFSKNQEKLKKYWYKKIRLRILEELFLLEMHHPKLAKIELEASARQKVYQWIKYKFNGLRNQGDAFYFEQYVNAYLGIHDVQTAYFTPKKKKEWDNQINRTLVGIGTVLKMDDGYPYIKEIMLGGAAWKSQEVKVGDKILKLKTAKKNEVELLGISLEQIIHLLRGEENTQLQLTLQEVNGNIKKITLTRTKIALDLAHSFVLTHDDSKHKIGYLQLPRFYRGEEGVALHTLEEINKLKKENVKGIILDLRNNKGGRASEARKIIGYFLEGGAVMQTSSRNSDFTVYEDDDLEAQYQSALVVLVNTHSGSASELLAGTIQDYNRGIIVGGKSTFGKGSIQRFYDLEYTDTEKNTKLGTVKMTIGQFYTGAGRTPQYYGITPDIMLPDDYKYIESGERVYEYATRPKIIPNVEVAPSKFGYKNKKLLQEKSQHRVTQNKKFKSADTKALAIAEEQNRSNIPLMYKDFKGYKMLLNQKKDSYRDIFVNIENLQFRLTKEDQENQDSLDLEKQARRIHLLKKDPYVEECFYILEDMLG